jgi:hypothetical protein
MGVSLYTEEELLDEDENAGKAGKIHLYQIKNFSRTFKNLKQEY